MANLNLDLPTTKLPNGAEMPVIGFGAGTAAMRNKKASGWLSSVDQGLVDNLKKAISLGFYHLDGAESYNTYVDIGAAIKAAKIPREKLFVTGKIDPDKSIDNIAGSLDHALKDLGLDYLDLFLIHQPFWAKDDEKQLQEKWADMEALLETGKTKAIGVSNYLRPHIDAILRTAKVAPMVNQIEYHPYLQREGLVDYLKSKNIQVTAFGPLAPVTKASDKNPEMNALLDDLAKKYYVHPAQILLRWSIEQDVIPITTTSKEITMSDHLRTVTFKLTPREVDQITELGKNVHYRGFCKQWLADDDRR